MTARHENQILAQRFGIPERDAATLRLAQLTLHRWAELECGDGNDYASWGIERDETTEVPYMVTHWHRGVSRDVTRVRTPDREAGALRRVAEVCKRNGLHFYHQTDPRGCALYVSRQPLTAQNYSGAGFPVIA